MKHFCFKNLKPGQLLINERCVWFIISVKFDDEYVVFTAIKWLQVHGPEYVTYDTKQDMCMRCHVMS